MKVFEGTDLPDDFFVKVQRYIETKRHHQAVEPAADPVFAVLGRSLTHKERMAIVDALHAGRLDNSVRRANAETPSAAGSK